MRESEEKVVISDTWYHVDQDDNYLSEIRKEKETDVFSGRIQCVVPLENMFLLTCLCSQIHNVIIIVINVTKTQISGHKMPNVANGGLRSPSFCTNEEANKTAETCVCAGSTRQKRRQRRKLISVRLKSHTAYIHRVCVSVLSPSKHLYKSVYDKNTEN